MQATQVVGGGAPNHGVTWIPVAQRSLMLTPSLPKRLNLERSCLHRHELNPHLRRNEPCLLPSRGLPSHRRAPSHPPGVSLWAGGTRGHTHLVGSYSTCKTHRQGPFSGKEPTVLPPHPVVYRHKLGSCRLWFSTTQHPQALQRAPGRESPSMGGVLVLGWGPGLPTPGSPASAFPAMGRS